MDEKQMTKGREAYRMMDEACNQLVQSGNWQRVGSSDIKLFLDMYVQALLLKMAQTTGEISGDMLTYIARVPARDILKIGQAAPQQALNIGFKNRSFAEGTPLLLRCCVAMDDKDGTATAQQFVDGVSRLLYAAADVDGDMSGNELNFITAYAGGLRTFLMTRAAGRHYDGAQEAVQRIDIPGVRRAHPAFSVVAAGVRFAHCAERAVEADILQIDHACLIGAQPAHLLGQCGVIHFITSLF